MAHDIYISYSSKDKPIADAVCANLEAAGIRCWIAPRDISPGEDWPSAVSRAISESRAMVLVFSANSNSSMEVSRELILAAKSKLNIIPFKIDAVEPGPGLQYYLARSHWLDAMNPPTREQLVGLVEVIRALVMPARLEPVAEAASTSIPQSRSRVPSDVPYHKKPNRFRKWFSILAGDSTTDAPPPVDKKNR